MQQVDDLTKGYLSAIATWLRIDHDYQTAQRVLREGGLTVGEIRAAGLGPVDEALLIQAIER